MGRIGGGSQRSDLRLEISEGRGEEGGPVGG